MTSIFQANGRQPQFVGKWKTTSMFRQMEDDFNFLGIEDDLNISGQMEDNLNYKAIGRQP